MAKENQAERIHRMQRDKKEAFFGVGDVVRAKSGKDEFLGEITCIEIRLQDGKLHPVIDLQCINAQASVWIENIEELEIIQFKGEKKNDTYLSN